MHNEVLLNFFIDLPPPPKLGFEKGTIRFTIAREIAKLDIYKDKNSFVYFRDVLYHTFKRLFGNFYFKKGFLLHDFLEKIIKQKE